MKNLEEIYATMAIARGNKQTYLWMELDFSTKSEVKVSAESFIMEALDDLLETIVETVSVLVKLKNLVWSEKKQARNWERNEHTCSTNI